jgi:hypothetical protein
MSGVTALRPNEAQEIAGYRLLGRLGEGGMGTVYLAQTSDGTQVALKIIRDHLLDREEFRLRFRGEVERAKDVPPFCTAEVLDADPDHDPPYLVVEYVDGPSLAEIVRESGPLGGARLHSLGIGVATALTAIHSAGVIHRDLKPGNVLLPRGGIKVIDFGLARDSDTATGITRTDQVMGTVPYIAPERLGGSAASGSTPAADVFAWGAVMVYAATGHTPFGGDTPATTAVRILTEEPNLQGLSGPLVDIVARTLKKNPKDRPTARELLDLLMSVGARSVPKDVAEAAQAATSTALPIRPGAADATSLDVGTTADVPVPKARRRGRGVLVGTLTTVLIAAVAAAVVASGMLRPDGVGASAPSATPDASPSAQPQPSQSGLIPVGLNKSLTDTLRRPGYWIAKNEPALKATCLYDERGLVATVEGPTYRCPGPKNAYGDVAVTAKVALVKQDTCAGIWFRYGDTAGGYALQICSDAAYFVKHHKNTQNHWTVTPLMSVRYDQALELGDPHSFTVVAVGSSMEFYLDDKELGGWSDTTFTSGRVCIGVLQRDPAAEGSQFAAAFSYIEVWGKSPTSAATNSGTA